MDFEKKNAKKVKVRKKILKPGTPIVNYKVYKIAKKINEKTWKLPIPQSIQEDLVFEKSEKPNLFLSSPIAHKSIQVISPVAELKSYESFAPTNIVGPLEQFYKRLSLAQTGAIKQNHRVRVGFEAKRIASKPSFVNLEEQMNNIRESIEKEKIHEKETFKKLTPGCRILQLRECKSLETYKKQQKYWEKLENNISEILQKEPEALSLNSARPYERKKAEIDLFDQIQKSEKKDLNFHWENTLRVNFDTKRPIKPQLTQRISINDIENSPRFNIKNTKLPSSSQGLRSSKYFQLELAKYNTNIESLLDLQDSDKLEVVGKGKLAMEYKAAKRIGINKMPLKALESADEEIIERKYESKVLY